VRIEFSTDDGANWSDVIASSGNTYSYSWTVPNTPSMQCLVRIGDAADPSLSDVSDAVFSILMNIALKAERLQTRAYSIARPYGSIQFAVGLAIPQAAPRIARCRGSDGFTSPGGGDPFAPRSGRFPANAFSAQVAEYRILRRQGGGIFELLRKVAPSELQDNRFQMQDRYLERVATYTYRVEAYDAAGQLIGISSERTI
jgi:hypothetical protein